MQKFIRKIKTIAVCALICSSLVSIAQAKPAPKGGGMPPAFVEVTQVQYGSVQGSVSATGTAVANPGIVVRSEVAGRITDVYFKSGADVAAGTQLIQIYPDIIKAQNAQDISALQLAKLNYERYAQLYASRTVSKADYDNAFANLAEARAKVAGSTAQLSQTLVHAPFTGRLGVTLVSVGQYINIGDNIVSLQTLDPIYVDFSVPETYSGQIAVGQDLTAHLDAYPGIKFSGKVYAVESLLDKTTRSFNVRAALPNPDKKILPGSFADINLLIGSKIQVIKIPQTAIVYSTDGNYVYRVINGKAVKTPVTLGDRDAQNVVVQDGLKVGETIVTAGQLKIMMDGSPVIVAPPAGVVPSANAAPAKTALVPQKNK